MPNVTFVNSQNFDAEVCAIDQPTIVEFWAEGCRPCDKLGKVIREYTDRLKIAVCNVDDNMEVAERYGVMNVPTLLFFKGGQMVDHAIGTVSDISENEVRGKVERLLSS